MSPLFVLRYCSYFIWMIVPRFLKVMSINHLTIDPCIFFTDFSFWLEQKSDLIRCGENMKMPKIMHTCMQATALLMDWLGPRIWGLCLYERPSQSVMNFYERKGMVLRHREMKKTYVRHNFIYIQINQIMNF